MGKKVRKLLELPKETSYFYTPSWDLLEVEYPLGYQGMYRYYDKMEKSPEKHMNFSPVFRKGFLLCLTKKQENTAMPMRKGTWSFLRRLTMRRNFRMDMLW